MQVISQSHQLQACIRGLAAARQQCLGVAQRREGQVALKRALDNGYVLACQCTQAREQIQVRSSFRFHVCFIDMPCYAVFDAGHLLCTGKGLLAAQKMLRAPHSSGMPFTLVCTGAKQGIATNHLCCGILLPTICAVALRDRCTGTIGLYLVYIGCHIVFCCRLFYKSPCQNATPCSFFN